MSESTQAQTVESVAADLEALRQERPINGDGSNNMLDKVLSVLAKYDMDAMLRGVETTEQARHERAERQQRRLAEMNRREG